MSRILEAVVAIVVATILLWVAVHYISMDIKCTAQGGTYVRTTFSGVCLEEVPGGYKVKR